MTLFRATVLDTPDDPFTGGALRAESDGGVLVRDGGIVARGGFASLRESHPDEEVVELEGGMLLPGFVDTHVHYPQVRAIAGLGMPLLDWLRHCALPEEARLADPPYAEAVATEFVSGVAQAGTTTALVFGSHFASAVDALFTEASRVGLRVTSGLVVSDRLLRDELLTTPQRAYDEGLALAGRWHGVGRNRYAVTPRFALSCGDELLASCSALLGELGDAWFTTHVNENLVEIETVAGLSPGCHHYVDSYDRHGLVGRHSILAHNVHPLDEELKLLASLDASVSHCPSSNSALGSGLFPLRRHVDHGVRVALGSDVGAGTGFSMLKEGLQAYFMQQLLGEDGLPLTPTHLLHLATAAGASALGLPDVGDLGVGKRFDAVWLRPRPGTTFDVALRHASTPEDALARAFALGTTADVAQVWVDGEPIPR
jgi:guanine deaminase